MAHQLWPRSRSRFRRLRNTLRSLLLRPLGPLSGSRVWPVPGSEQFRWAQRELYHGRDPFPGVDPYDQILELTQIAFSWQGAAESYAIDLERAERALLALEPAPPAELDLAWPEDFRST